LHLVGFRTGLKLTFSKPLRGSSKLINPSIHTNFQLILLKWFVWEEWHFINCNSRDHIIITHCWLFHCNFMVFSSIYFKPQKVWGSIVNLLLYQFSASYSCFTLWAWQHIGSWIIENIFASVYRILTKLGTKMHPYTTFLYTKFQGLDNPFPRYGNFHNLMKRRGKKEKLSQFVEVYISETPGPI